MPAVAERGRTVMKFFPAEAAGAPDPASPASPLPQLRLRPTGSITVGHRGALPGAAERGLPR